MSFSQNQKYIGNERGKRKFMFAVFLILLCCGTFSAQTDKKRVAVLDASEIQNEFAANLTAELAVRKNLKLLDADLSAAAWRAAKIENPFNLSLADAQNLGAAIDCDFYIFVRSADWRRSSFQKDVYFESFAVIFLVSARTGELVAWENPIFAADKESAARKILFAETEKIADRFADKIAAAHDREKAARAVPQTETIVIADLPDEATENLRVPLPYKRISPVYTAAAARLDIEATVDAAVEIDEKGVAGKIRIVRWAGFDLDEAAIAAIKKMQFRPALRDGAPFAVRVLLRYNFRDARNE